MDHSLWIERRDGWGVADVGVEGDDEGERREAKAHDDEGVAHMSAPVGGRGCVYVRRRYGTMGMDADERTGSATCLGWLEWR